MTAPRLEIDGVRETTRALKGIGVEAADLRAAHQRVAELVTPLAAQRTRRKSGALAASWAASATPGVARIRSGLPYAAPQEFGWPAHGIEPTMSVASSVEANADQVLDLYAAELGKIIDREGG